MKKETLLIVIYFLTYLPIDETYFLQNWLPKWNQILSQLRFDHNWAITGIQWMVYWGVPVHCGQRIVDSLSVVEQATQRLAQNVQEHHLYQLGPLHHHQFPRFEVILMNPKFRTMIGTLNYGEVKLGEQEPNEKRRPCNIHPWWCIHGCWFTLASFLNLFYQFDGLQMRLQELSLWTP